MRQTPTKLLKEMNGYYTATPDKHLAGFGALADDGSTTCASWIYSGVYPAPDKNLAASKEPDPPGQRGAAVELGLRVAGEQAAACTTAPRPTRPGSPGVNGRNGCGGTATKWTGYDVPDFAPTKAPTAQAKPGGIGLDALSGTDAFIMKPDGVGWLYVPTGLVDGPLPTQYEPAESPVHNPFYKQQSSPVFKYWKDPANVLAAVGDPTFPYVMTTYRLTEHYLSGAMSRWLPWLTELQPELFVEISPELAQEKGIHNLDWVRISSPRSHVRAKVLVTRRLRPLQIDGRTIHHVGMPWHWGYEGLTTGDVVNELTAMVADPNISIHEGKAFVCNLEKA